MTETETYQVKAGLDTIESFDVIGVSTMTQRDKATDDINTLWEQFFKLQIGQSIEAKVSDVIYAVYSDYEGDDKAPYRVTIGYRVSAASYVPTGLHHLSVGAGDYAVLSAAGEQPKALVDTWHSVWESDLNRAFKTDFEVYGPRFFDPDVGEALIYVGVA